MVDEIFHVEYFSNSDEYRYTRVYRFGSEGLLKYESTYTFKGMMYDDIRHNLEIMSNLNVGEKLMIDNVRLHVDNRWFMIIQRQFFGDNRERTCALIAHTYNQLLKCKTEYELTNDFIASFNGLKNLAKTYNDFNITYLMKQLENKLQNLY